jgi:hypothetical protein
MRGNKTDEVQEQWRRPRVMVMAINRRRDHVYDAKFDIAAMA